MLVQEPVQAAVWHCLNHYDYKDATFLSERLYAEVPSDESLNLLATCYFRSGKTEQAYHVLKKGAKTASNKFLLAKCCMTLNKLPEAESVLCGHSSPEPRKDAVEGVVSELGDSAAFGLQLLATIYRRTENPQKAIECEQRALQLNPFLFKSYEALCNSGVFPDPAKVFSLEGLESLNQCHGHNPILSLANSISGAPSCTVLPEQPAQQGLPPPVVSACPPHVNATSTPNVAQMQASMITPQFQKQLQITGGLGSVPFSSVKSLGASSTDFSIPMIDITPSSMLSITANASLMSGVGVLNFSQADSTCSSDASAATASAHKSALMLPPLLRRKVQTATRLVRQRHDQEQRDNGEAEGSFGTPTFGVLAKGLVPTNLVALRLNFSSPALSILSPMTGNDTPGSVNVSGIDKILPTPKQKLNETVNKENPPKQNVFGQSGHNSGSNINQSQTPAANTMVRRSSRLFGSTQSVKENSKAPTKKPRVAATSSSRCAGLNKPANKGRLALSNQSELAEKNEMNRSVDRASLGGLSDGVKTDDLALLKKAQLISQNLPAQALVIQKQSVDGLMRLLRQLAVAYAELARFNCRKAVEVLEAVPQNHKRTGWVLGLMGRAHFELAEYKSAKMCFKRLRSSEPHRTEFMEYYSTCLWQLQEEVELSTLAHDLTRVDKFSPQTWCAVGNCFSHLKEHENAIKFFQRSIQIDPNFAYAYTLLGHEYIAIEELDKALANFRDAVRVDPRHYNAWYGIGLTYYKQERYQMADMYFRKSLTFNPTNPILMCHVAVVQHSLKRTEKALETLDNAIRLAPKNSLCKFEKASILFSAERFDDALAELEELKQLSPKESPVYYLLGKVHTKLNNTHLALMHFSWATDLDPKGAHSQIKDTLDPLLSRAAQEDAAAPASSAAGVVAADQQEDESTSSDSSPTQSSPQQQHQMDLG